MDPDGGSVSQLKKCSLLKVWKRGERNSLTFIITRWYYCWQIICRKVKGFFLGPVTNSLNMIITFCDCVSDIRSKPYVTSDLFLTQLCYGWNVKSNHDILPVMVHSTTTKFAWTQKRWCYIHTWAWNFFQGMGCTWIFP